MQSLIALVNSAREASPSFHVRTQVRSTCEISFGVQAFFCLQYSGDSEIAFANFALKTVLYWLTSSAAKAF